MLTGPKKYPRFLLLAFCGLFILSGCREEPKKIVTSAPVTFTKEGDLSLLKGGSDSLIVQLDIEIAEGEYETQTGLMYRDGMETYQGMLFVFPEEAYHSFYMKNTRFPLDIIYIDRDSTITSIVKNAQPLQEKSLPSTQPVIYVLEVNAGLSETWGLQVGDQIRFTRE
ncbi:hypothetical protein SAMN06265375_102404 [Muriicola jejuensis]|uniref:DUF192 domain-containing protein n=1 Tax=Muriicola jejuensis TaxID=504488 RepID=A0A6P0UDQ8_9FLAO|nr:DUF192 domain-containing protein [Muriicola jejuensis]NER10620.1 DUF192 domain-containing protein [Muriicola jejuensis]SMP17499.1 hypothetical protein SAMN06265375_102404 [Muriicola jejuensis]